MDEADANHDLLVSAVLRAHHRDELERLMGTPEFRARFASSRTLTEAAAGPASMVTFFRGTGELVKFLDWALRPQLEKFGRGQGVADLRAAEIAQAALAWIVQEHPDPADPAAIEDDLDLARELIGALAGQGTKSGSAPENDSHRDGSAVATSPAPAAPASAPGRPLFWTGGLSRHPTGEPARYPGRHWAGGPAFDRRALVRPST